MGKRSNDQEVRAAVYLRISKDAEGDEEAVQRQEEDCRTLIKRRGWKVAEVFKDNDISAYSGKVRPRWEALLTGIEAWEFDAIVAYSSSRMYRRVAELLRLTTLLQDKPDFEIATIASGDIRLTTADDRMIAGMLAVVDQAEVERLKERSRRERKAKAETMNYRTQGPAGYGYEYIRDDRQNIIGLRVVEHERDIIEQVVARLLDQGETMNSVVKWLNDRREPTPRGKGARWTWETLKRVITSPRITALQQYRREIIGEGRWEPIIARERWQELQNYLETIRVGWKYRAPDPNGYLLSGLLFCGDCGGPMHRSHSNGKPAYGCRNGRVGEVRHDNGWPYVSEAEMEEWVGRETSVRVPPANDDGAEAKRAELQGQIDDLIYRFQILGEMDREEYAATYRVLATEIQRLPKATNRRAAPDSPRAKLDALLDRIEVVSNQAITGNRNKRVPIDQRASIQWREGVSQTAPVPEAPRPEAKPNPNCSVVNSAGEQCDQLAQVVRTRKWAGMGPLCQTHYRRFMENGDVQADKPIEVHRRRDPNETCDVPRCDRRVQYRSGPEPYRNICSPHYNRWARVGDVQANKPFRRDGGRWSRERQPSREREALLG